MITERAESLGYTIPVKIQLEPGRFKHGFVKTLTPDSRGNVRIMYMSGRISSRSIDGVEHEPQGFRVRQ